MKLRLLRKLADEIDGIDLRGHAPGDILDLPRSAAHLLIAENWAVAERRKEQTGTKQRRRADDSVKRKKAR